jgi:hypothetical protein
MSLMLTSPTNTLALSWINSKPHVRAVDCMMWLKIVVFYFHAISCKISCDRKRYCDIMVFEHHSFRVKPKGQPRFVRLTSFLALQTPFHFIEQTKSS